MIFKRILIIIALSIPCSGNSSFLKAYNSWKDSSFIQEAEKYSSNSPKDTYWRNVIRFHRVNLLIYGFDEDRDKEKARDLIKKSIKELELLEEKSNFNGEVPALTATLRGIGITLNPLSALLAGPKIQKEMARAFATDSLNPRTMYLLGVSYYHMPKIVGGGFKTSRRYLEKSVKLFEKEVHEDKTSYKWGYSTALSFLGEIYLKEGRLKKAARWYRTSLMVNPEDPLALLGLSEIGESEK